MKKTTILLMLILTVFCFSSVFGTDRPPINVNLIIDGSSSLEEVKAEIIPWLNGRLDQVLVNGDRVTVWLAETTVRVLFSGTVNNQADKEAVKEQIRGISGSASTPDFAGALRAAAGLSSPSFSYTLLISASPENLSSVLSGPQANHLRFSRIQEFSTWRAVIVGLNLDARVQRAARAFMN